MWEGAWRMGEARVTVVIVTYESSDTIDGALSAGKSAHEAGLARYVVVDNASSDGTAERVRARHPWVKVIETGENLGFGRGCNVGLDDATTPFVLFLNPDAAMEAGELAKLVEFMEARPRAGLAGPALVGEGEEHQPAGSLPTPWRIVAGAARLNGYPGRRPIVPGAAAFETDWICGAALMGRTDVLREMGGFDPRFFLYFDETDLCRRMLDRGLEVWAVGTAVARHAKHGSARKVETDLIGGCIAGHYFRSRFYYLGKHHGRAAAWAAEAGELFFLALRDAARFLLRMESKGLVRQRLLGPMFSVPVREGAGVGEASRSADLRSAAN